MVNNVETLAAVPWIVANGSSAYAAIGGPDAPGTTLVQLSGAVKRPGIVEVPMGTSLRAIVEGVGGGSTGTLKAVLVGGPSGGFLPADVAGHCRSATPRCRRRAPCWARAPSSPSTRRPCLVDLSALLTRYLTDEACGKTIPCRIGTRRLAELGQGFCTGRSRPTDATLVADLAADIRDAALCGLERTAVNPLLTGMRYFGQEFEDHIDRGSCLAGVCQPIRVASVAHR